jgi:hypothetical protein
MAVALQITAPVPVSARGMEAEQHDVVQTIYAWAAAWENNIYSIDSYQSYYHPSFFASYKTKSGMNYQQWMADKAAKGRKAGCIQVQVSGIRVTIEGDLATAVFQQQYLSGTYCDVGTKTLWLLKTPGGWKIVGEEQPSVAKCGNRCLSKTQAQQSVVMTIYNWAAAWESNVYSLDGYRSYYDPGFFANYKSRSGMNYQQWMADKAAKARKTDCIWVQVSDISVTMDQDFATARFMQRYTSGGYCDQGWKTLYLIRRGNSWKIIGEEQPSTSKCNERCYPEGD